MMLPASSSIDTAVASPGVRPCTQVAKAALSKVSIVASTVHCVLTIRWYCSPGEAGGKGGGVGGAGGDGGGGGEGNGGGGEGNGGGGEGDGGGGEGVGGGGEGSGGGGEGVGGGGEGSGVVRRA